MILFLSALGLGFAFCALPGAVTTQVVRRGLERGFRSAMSLQLGALVGVALWAILALMGVAILVQQPFVRFVLGAVGFVFLLWLMWQALRAAWRGTAAGEVQTVKVKGDIALGAALSLANPGALAFWLGIGSTVLAPDTAAAHQQVLVGFLAGFLSGAVLWCLLFAGLLAWGRRLVTPLFFRVVNLICGFALGFFALKLLWSTILLVTPSIP